MRIATLGPEGTFSQHAAMAFHKGAELMLCDDLEDVFNAVENRDCELGLVPLENSLEGSVSLSLDLLSSHSLFIVGELVEPIRHSLLSLGKLEDVRIVVSHPQAMAQCRNFLRDKLHNAEFRTTGSTTHAARMAQEFTEMAAIAPKEAARIYGLNVLSKDIQDKPNNYTRFIAVALEPFDGSADKTSLLFEVEDKPGSLYNVLGAFALRDVNLTKIESRPSKLRLGEYVFFIDILGAQNEPRVHDAISHAGEFCSSLRILGSYPSTRTE